MSRRRDRTSGIVAGALRSCIHDHGPVEEHHVGSATKRIVEGLASAAANGAAVISDADAASAIDSLRRRLAKFQHGHRITLDQYARCRAERDELRTALEGVRLVLADRCPDWVLEWPAISDHEAFTVDEVRASANGSLNEIAAIVHGALAGTSRGVGASSECPGPTRQPSAVSRDDMSRGRGAPSSSAVGPGACDGR